MNRLFAFGCSFTKYNWAMWPEVVKLEYNPKEFYNFGRCGAGNRYISHQVALANLEHKFTPDDMVMISWTHIFRTDWYMPGHFGINEIEKGWETLGNMYYPHGMNEFLPPSILEPINFIARDLLYIYMTINMLRGMGVPNHQMQIVPVTQRINENFIDTIEEQERNHDQILPLIEFCEDNILDPYEKHIDVLPTWFQQFPQDEESRRSDYHPMPIHHCDYLEKVVGLDISKSTRDVAQRCQDAAFEFIRQARSDKPEDFSDFYGLFQDDNFFQIEDYAYLEDFK